MRDSIVNRGRGALALLAGLVLAAAPGTAVAQDGSPPDGAAAADTVPSFPPGVSEVDRVIAIVGDTAILRSELDLAIFQIQSEGAQIPPEGTPDWTRLVHQVLEAMIDNVIVIQEARRAGLSADPGRVDQAAEQVYQQRRRNFASDEEMAQAVSDAGMNMLQFRQMLRQQAEQRELLGAFQQSIRFRDDLPPVVITESEVQAYFDEQARDQTRPALVSYNRLFVSPIPSGDAAEDARNRVILAQNDLQNGEDFDIVARRYSDDAGTRERGGELGWLRRSDVVKPFGDAAWSVRPGSWIGPVRTRFGLHLIEVERARGSERFLRHVLIRPEFEDADREEARRVAGEIADSLAAGVDPERLAGLYRDHVVDEDIRVDNVEVGTLVSNLTGEAATALQSPIEGEVYGPYPIELGGPTEYGVFQIVEFRPAGPYRLDEVRDQIRQTLRLQRQLEVILAEFRDRTFIDVKI